MPSEIHAIYERMFTAIGSRVMALAIWDGPCVRPNPKHSPFPRHFAESFGETSDALDLPGRPLPAPTGEGVAAPSACRECGAAMPTSALVRFYRRNVYPEAANA